MIETINGKAYIKKGDKLYEVGGGGNANFIFANSKEELPDPSTVPENTVGLVPSEGASGGLPIVDIDTAPDANGEQILLSGADAAKLDEISASHENCFMRIFGLDGYKYLVPMALTAGDIDGVQIKIWGGSYHYGGIGFMNSNGVWIMALIPINGE